MQSKYLLFFLFCIGLSITATAQPAFTSMDVFDLQWASSPQISPDGETIVYVRRSMDIMKDRRVGNLWTIKTDGTGHRKLTNRDASESNPTWSPDGSRIAFTSSTDQGSEIFVYWLESGSLARISQLEGGASGLSWSPDGTKLAFSMFIKESFEYLVKPPKKPQGAQWAKHPFMETRLKHEADGSGYMPAGYSHYFLISAEGGAARQLTSGPFNHRGAPVWSKDGAHLYFSGNRNENWAYDFRNSEIYQLSVADGDIKALTDRNGPDRGITLSPDGKTIAYVGYDDKVQTYQVSHLYLMDSNGGNKRMITTNLDRSISDLSWAADGQGLYFVYDNHGNTKIGYTTLGGKTTVIANDAGGINPARPYGGGEYSLASNGWIAYPHTTPYHPAEVALTKMGEKAPKLLTSLSEDLLSNRTLGKVEEIWYKSSVDKRDVQGWIVKPPFFDSERTYPLLVENHGGPISNYG
ncbi:MAG: DPP IV N-terminal domain-containing protein, partial [Bacteroidota bacterium]